MGYVVVRNEIDSYLTLHHGLASFRRTDAWIEVRTEQSFSLPPNVGLRVESDGTFSLVTLARPRVAIATEPLQIPTTSPWRRLRAWLRARFG